MVVLSWKFGQNLCQVPLCQNLLCQIGIHELKDSLQQKHIIEWLIERALFVCFYGGPNLPFQKQDFSCSRALKGTPHVTSELKVREQNQLGFLNISIRPTSGTSFIKIGRPTFSTSGTLSQTMTLNSHQQIVWGRWFSVYDKTGNFSFYKDSTSGQTVAMATTLKVSLYIYIDLYLLNWNKHSFFWKNMLILMI